VVFPEYVQWLKTVPPVVWVYDEDALRDLPNAKRLPYAELRAKYGDYVWTSSVAYMLAMAIEKILAARAAGDAGPHVIGLWGVDMAANEELYTGQRAACQFFLQVLVGLKIEFYVPHESDLCVPPPPYGVSEVNHRAIKWLERRRELESRLAQTNAQAQAAQHQALFIQGALDDLDYMQKMWLHEGDSLAFDFDKNFPGTRTVSPLTAEAAQLQEPAAPPRRNLSSRRPPRRSYDPAPHPAVHAHKRGGAGRFEPGHD
jgi:hypothetical protein